MDIVVNEKQQSEVQTTCNQIAYQMRIHSFMGFIISFGHFTWCSFGKLNKSPTKAFHATQRNALQIFPCKHTSHCLMHCITVEIYQQQHTPRHPGVAILITILIEELMMLYECFFFCLLIFFKREQQKLTNMQRMYAHRINVSHIFGDVTRFQVANFVGKARFVSASKFTGSTFIALFAG